jgi:hypothetical protein
MTFLETIRIITPVIIATCFLAIGIRMLIADRPFLIRSRWNGLLFLIIFAQPIVTVVDAIFSRGLESLYWGEIAIGMLIPAFFVVIWRFLHGYLVIGVTPESFRNALQDALQRLNLPYQESLSRFRLTSLGVDLQASTREWFGIASFRLNKSGHGVTLKNIVRETNRHFAALPQKIKTRAGILYFSVGVIEAFLAVTILVMYRVDEFTADNYAEPGKLVGKVSWVIHESVTGKTIDQGTSAVYLRDITVKGRYERGVSLFSPRITPEHFIKEVRLNKDFSLVKREFPRAERPVVGGIVMAADHRTLPTSCYEWFEFDGENHATKSEETGEIAFAYNKVSSAWEMSRTEFLSDVTFRVNLIGSKDRRDFPKWRVTILKGSFVNWPSLVGDTVVPIY